MASLLACAPSHVQRVQTPLPPPLLQGVATKKGEREDTAYVLVYIMVSGPRLLLLLLVVLVVADVSA